MRVAFIPTAYRTPIFLGIAGRLQARGHVVSWLSPNRRWAAWLVRQGVDSGAILDVTRSGEAWAAAPHPTPADMGRLETLEAGGTLKARDIVSMDPLLRRRPTDYALRYLAVCAGLLQEFLTEQEIDIVFGEQTWAFELLTGQVSNALRIEHLMPHTVRIPDPRFGFFAGPLEASLVRIDDAGAEHREQAERHLREFRSRRPQPAYMSINRSVLQPEWGRLRTLTQHVLDLAGDPYDETSRRPLGLIVDHTKQILRRQRNLRSPLLERPSEGFSQPFVYFPLHMQPEASLDIKGAPYTSQVEVVRALSRTLPLRHGLLVKEHGIALARRSRTFYRELAAIPGVRLLHPSVDSFALTQEAALTVTITGTAAYEAALMGRAAATVAPVFFDRIVDFPRFDPFRDRLDEALEQTKRRCSEDDLVAFLADVLANSFPGIVGDALWQPDTAEAGVLDRVAAGFLTVLERQQRHGTAPTRL